MTSSGILFGKGYKIIIVWGKGCKIIIVWGKGCKIIIYRQKTSANVVLYLQKPQQSYSFFNPVKDVNHEYIYNHDHLHLTGKTPGGNARGAGSYW